jgi:hypothetical protein
MTWIHRFLFFSLFFSSIIGEEKKNKHFLDGVTLGAFKLRSVGPALTSGRVSD